jgi:beta-phosphoglucomutase-like phosphatase (HAD superfamily)
MHTRLGMSQQRLGWLPPAGFVRDFECRLIDPMRRDLQAVPGIREALDRLRRPWCAASHGTHEDRRLRLGRAGLLESFEPSLCSASEVAQPTPAPNHFLYAAQSWGAWQRGARSSKTASQEGALALQRA